MSPHHNSWPFGALKPFSYDLIVADPPWSFDNWSKKGEVKNAKAHYDCMSLEDIKRLPVGDLANSEGCVLVLWATNPMWPQALECLKAWGFEYKTAAAWHKKTINGKTAFGTGYVLRSAHEPILIGTIGKPKYSRKARSLFEGRVGAHSVKPGRSYDWAKSILKMSDPKSCELFSRTARAGWDTWGKEAGKFEGEPGFGDLVEQCEAKFAVAGGSSCASDAHQHPQISEKKGV